MTAPSRKDQKQPTANSRLSEWLRRNKPDKAQPATMKTLPAGSRAPLSYGQLRLWFLQKMNPGNPFYHYAERYSIDGELSTRRFIDSFKKIIVRHPILRTTFPESNGQPWQQINTSLDPEITELDLRSLSDDEKEATVNDTIHREATRAFDLVNGPLIRLALFHMDEQSYQFMLVMHHIIADQWSLDIIHQEWASLYQEKDPENLSEYRYVDFAFAQRQEVISEVNLKYWTEKLAGDLSRLEFPLCKHHNLKNPTYKGACHKWNLSPEIADSLKKLSKQGDATMFVLLLSIFKVLLYRYTGESDIVVATPVSNRTQRTLENMIGFFNETMILRDQLDGNIPFMDLVNAVQSTVLEAFAHKDIPFESLVKTLKPDRMASTNPLFQVMFLYHKATETPSLAPNVSWKHHAVDIGVSKFDLTLHIHEEDEQLSVIFEYAHDLFPKASIHKMQGHLNQLISGITKDPNLPISQFPLITEEECSVILGQWNHPVKHTLPYQSVTQLLESAIQKHSQHTAVIVDNQSISYHQLGALADHYSSLLLDHGVVPGDKVGICSGKSMEMIIGMIAVLKVGAAYVPMDAQYPLSRLEFMTSDAEVSVILTQKHLVDRISTFQAKVIPIDPRSGQIAGVSNSYSQVSVQESSCAYIMYTSGSTGQPKGVSITHGNLLSSTLARTSYYPDHPDSFLLMSSHGFDSSVAGIFWTLSTGGTLILPPDRIEQDMSALSDLIAQHQVTHSLMLPSLYDLLLQHGIMEKLGSLRTVIVAGEACTAKTCKNHFSGLPQVQLYNEYGPTEATVWSTVYKISKDDQTGLVPIGRPIENSRVYLLDQSLGLVPAGVVGEIYISGKGNQSRLFESTAANQITFYTQSI